MNIRNPLTGEYDFLLQADSPTKIEQEVLALRDAQTSWQQIGLSKRLEILGKWLGSLEKHSQEIIDRLSIDTGRKGISAIEFQGVKGMIQGWLYRAPQLMQVPAARASSTKASVMIQQQWIPYEVVGVISPWNFPLLLALIDSIPALLAGSAVILKPSEVTPRFIDPLEASIKAVPELDAVFKLARGGAETGKAIVNSADAICFTGSVPTGRSIAAACAARFIPAFLELGGKDPAIVLKDVDVDLAVDAVLRSCVGATGQACQSLERIYVDKEIFEVFVEKIVIKAKGVELARPNMEGQVGPLIFHQQAEKIQEQIDDAREQGAVIHTGGKVENIDGGLWCRPTVITGVTHQMKVMSEETFGPLIPIMPYEHVEQALEFANDSIYGLSASVFGRNSEETLAVASQLEAGAISINDASLTNSVYDAEKNSFKQSGINGSRMGDAGFLRFFRKKALLIQQDYPVTIDSFTEKA